jgi:hypothetical protein
VTRPSGSYTTHLDIRERLAKGETVTITAKERKVIHSHGRARCPELISIYHTLRKCYNGNGGPRLHSKVNLTTFTMRLWLRSALLVVALGACASPYGVLRSLTPEQIAAWAKVKDVVSSCAQVNTPWGPQKLVIVSVDKGLEATVTVDPDCKQVIKSGDAKK